MKTLKRNRDDLKLKKTKNCDMRMKEASSRLTESFEHTGSFKIGH